MSFLFRSVETRDITSWPWPWSVADSPVNGSTLSTALSLVPVYAATGLIADQLAAAPWAAYAKSSGAPDKLRVQPDLIVNPGVNELDLFSWKYQMVTSLLLRGNAYGLILAVDTAGRPSKVQWLRPDKMQVDEDGSKPEYFFNGVRLDRSTLIHIPLYVVPGSVVGLSPIGLFRTQIETGIEAQRTGRTFFRRGGVPSGVLKNSAKSLTAEAAAETKKRFIASVSSSEPFVTGMDWDYSAIQLPSSDVNFLSGIRATANQIAAVYRVEPEDVGGETSGTSLTYATLEMNQLKFNSRTMLPIATRIESVTNRYLLDWQYVKFNLDAAIRADLKTRYEAHKIAIDAGFKIDDEVRKLEELPPLTSSERDQILLMRGKALTGGK